MHAFRFLMFSLIILACLKTTSCSGMDLLWRFFEGENNNILGEDGLTPLMRAFSMVNYKEALSQLNKRPSLDTKSSDGRTIFELFLASNFDQAEKALLARKLISIALEQSIKIDTLPIQIQRDALRGCSPHFAAFLHMIAPSDETRATLREYGLAGRQNSLLNDATATVQEFLGVSAGSFLTLYLFVWLFLTGDKPLV